MMAATWTDPACEAIAHLLTLQTGLAFAPNRIANLEAAVRRAVARSAAGGAAEYLRLLESGEIPLDDLISDATVGETYFFRDPALFEYLRREVLPELAQRTGPARPLRLWSAGCASGEEAYSLAILFEEEGLASRSRILATDVSRTALARAQAAAYGQWSMRSCDPAFIERYFQRVGDRLVLKAGVRSRVSFEYLNLAVDSYPSLATGTWGMDLIFCRNVMIYLDRQTIEKIAQRLLECLADGGLLVTGPSDPWISEIVSCEPVTTPVGTFYRRRGGVELKEGRSPPSTPALPPGSHAGLAPSEPLSPPPSLRMPSGAPASAPTSITGADPLDRCRDAFAAGQYDRVLEITRARDPQPGVAEVRVRSLANIGCTVEAESEAQEALAVRPLSAELHFLRGVLLMNLGEDAEAARALRRAIYLDRSLAVAHFALGFILRRSGDLAAARRAYCNALDLCSVLPPGAPVPLSDGDCAGRIAEACRVQIDLLQVES